MEVLFVLAMSIVALVYLIMIARQNKRNGMVGTYAAVFFTIILYYAIIPIICFTQNTEDLGEEMFAVSRCTPAQFLFVLFCLILFSAFFHFTYLRYNNFSKKQVYRFDKKKLTRALRWTGVLTVVVGGLSFVGYIYAFGGISRLLYYADYLRTFASSATEFVSYYASLLIIPAKLITVAPIVLLPLILQKRRNRLWLILIFLACFVLAVIFGLVNAGKAGLIVFAMCFAIPFLEKFTKRPWTLTIMIGILCLPLLGVLDKLFSFMRTGDWSQRTISVFDNLNQFAYVYQNVMNLPKIVENFGLRWGQDFITGVLNVLPGFNFEPAYAVTSEYFNGANWVHVAGRPTDVLTFGYLQFGPFGIMLMGALLGMVSAKIDRILLDMPRDGTYSVLTASMLTCTYTYFVNADVTSVIRGQFQLWLVALCLIYATRVVPPKRDGTPLTASVRSE